MPYSNGGGLPPRYPPYPGGTPGGGGGSGGGGGTSTAPSSYIPLSNGGVFAKSKASLFPCFNATDNRTEFMAFDPTQGYNDENNGSSYSFRVEDFTYRTPTIRRVVISYTDLGQVEATLTMTGANDKQQLVSKETPLTLGNDPPKIDPITGQNALLTQKVDFIFTAMNPQCTISKEANAGPLSLIKVTLIGEVEEAKI